MIFITGPDFLEVSTRKLTPAKASPIAEHLFRLKALRAVLCKKGLQKSPTGLLMEGH
jgi:hypothetical protein